MNRERELLKRALDELNATAGTNVDELASLCEEIKAELERPEQEPVAYQLFWKHSGEYFGCCPYDKDANSVFDTVPLYTSPPQQKALSEESANEAFDKYTDNFNLDGNEWEDMGRKDIFIAGVRFAENHTCSAKLKPSDHTDQDDVA